MAGDDALVFDEVQIGRGLRPLAQHGFVVIGDGMITLLDSKREQIHTGPLSATSAKPIRVTFGKSLSVKIGSEKFNVSPGWGVFAERQKLFGSNVKQAADLLLHLIENDGRLPAEE